MNTVLLQNKLCQTSSPVTILHGGLTATQNNTISFPRVPSLEEMLDEIGPLPKTALFLGQAEDELPVLLDLSNPRPGPILIAGDPGAGKTHLLQVIARFIARAHPQPDVQCGVISSCPQEWDALADARHCVGIFPATGGAAEFIHALALWAHMEKTPRRYVLLLIDGLDEIASLDRRARNELCTLLTEGPANQIWPIATVDPRRARSAGDWLKHFQTRVFGYTNASNVLDGAGDPPADRLAKGIEFRVKKGTRQIKFRVPRFE